MPLNPKDLKAWAQGVSADAMKPSQLDADAEEADDFEVEDEAGHNAIWAGEEEVTEETDESAVVELFEWLEENEPELHDAFAELAAALESGDVKMLEHAQSELMAATQFLTPEYPPMTPEKRQEAATLIAQAMETMGHPSKDSPGWYLAMAIGLSQSRQAEEEETEETEEVL